MDLVELALADQILAMLREVPTRGGIPASVIALYANEGREKTFRVLDGLHTQGMIRRVGVSCCEAHTMWRRV